MLRREVEFDPNIQSKHLYPKLLTTKYHDLWSLSLNICLRAPLRRLPIIMFVLILLLRLPVTGQPSNSASHSSRHSIPNARPQIAQLTLRLLAFPLSVLLDAFTLQTVGADQVPNAFFR